MIHSLGTTSSVPTGVAHCVAVVLALSFIPAFTSAAEKARSDWQQKAETAVKAVVDDAAAEKIRAILHPTGKNGELQDLTVEDDGTGVIVFISVRWQGGLIGHTYTTKVRWRFNKTDHLGSAIESDTAITKAGDEQKTHLDDHLRKKVLPAVQEKIGK